MAITTPLKYSECDTIEEVQQLQQSQREYYLNEVTALQNLPASQRPAAGEALQHAFREDQSLARSRIIELGNRAANKAKAMNSWGTSPATSKRRMSPKPDGRLPNPGHFVALHHPASGTKLIDYVYNTTTNRVESRKYGKIRPLAWSMNRDRKRVKINSNGLPAFWLNQTDALQQAIQKVGEISQADRILARSGGATPESKTLPKAGPGYFDNSGYATDAVPEEKHTWLVYATDEVSRTTDFQTVGADIFVNLTFTELQERLKDEYSHQEGKFGISKVVGTLTNVRSIVSTFE